MHYNINEKSVNQITYSNKYIYQSYHIIIKLLFMVKFN